MAPLQTAVNREARQEVVDALEAFGFGSISAGVRVVLLTFARSEEVRQAVRTHLHHAVAPEGAR